ncbi:MAG: SH3 domain-containing protein, partial [Clostridiales bacterium]|nr:SH3 domain-containing protein [Clostridiales bacterium]
MAKLLKKITTMILTGTTVCTMLSGGCLMQVQAAPNAGVAGYTSNALTSASIPTAGVAAAFISCMSSEENDAVLASAQPEVSENDTPTVASEFADIAVATVVNYVNIREEPDEESEKVGKLYANGVATVLETDGDWYKITSGSVTGYVYKDYVSVGDESLARSVGRRIATVTTETLKVRKSASTDSEVIGLVPGGEDLTVVDESKDGWVGVSVEEGNGYVSADYVELGMEYSYAESTAEEEARLAREEAEREAAEAAASSSSGSSSGSTSSVSRGQQVANYACQFVGNPYVYGGTSLTNGADCSGFVMSVYAHFGVSLPHSSSSLRSVGYAVSVSEMQPGDI